ncbi:probable basic-leucine zipper transcription factor D [Saccostrea echinata]|uniref:probable basic-leucine zipper transcription factor D n=1 Tax=Saccostrea echinata TaxID=191078 RepID=UPI002A80BB5D|nr:probable basic-leucine zipper transcription factor D [Saccostrea echinata]
MEFNLDGSGNDVNCLLNNFMESDILVDDVILGIPEENEYTELSPSHSSDSGYSGMTSPCYSVTSEEDGDVSVKNEEMSLFPDTLDQEIAGYLSSDNSNDCVDIVSIASRQLTTPVCDFVSEQENVPNVAITVKAISPFEVPKRETRNSKKGKVKALSENDTNQQKVQKTVGKRGQDLNTTRLPPIKVIKVIKTPADSSPKETQDQIYEAMEERNRKNAVQAKINREKKKAYIKNLEDDVELLKSENKTLKENCDKLQMSHKVMEEELDYLRSVLANQSALSNLLQNIPNVKNVELSSSFSRKRQSIDRDHDYPTNKRPKSVSAGVCLHVHQDKVSLEFCAKCSSAAASHGENV